LAWRRGASFAENQPLPAFVVDGVASDGERHGVLQDGLADGRRSGPGKGSDVARSRNVGTVLPGPAASRPGGRSFKSLNKVQVGRLAAKHLIYIE